MGVSHAGSNWSLSVFVRSLTPISGLDRLTARFEIAVENFFRSAFDLQVNEAAYQAWYAASVIAEFGLSKVYREEVHLIRSQLADLVSPEIVVGFEKGNELVPDLSVSWEEAIDARHTQARPPELDAAGMLDQFGVITEFKATASTTKPTPPAAIRRDLRKLGLYAEAHKERGSNPLAAYMVILDNHRKGDDKPPTASYRPDRMTGLSEGCSQVDPADRHVRRARVSPSRPVALFVEAHQDQPRFLRLRGGQGANLLQTPQRIRKVLEGHGRISRPSKRPSLGWSKPDPDTGGHERLWSHNPKVAGSNPAPATIEKPRRCLGLLLVSRTSPWVARRVVGGLVPNWCLVGTPCRHWRFQGSDVNHRRAPGSGGWAPALVTSLNQDRTGRASGSA